MDDRDLEQLAVRIFYGRRRMAHSTTAKGFRRGVFDVVRECLLFEEAHPHIHPRHVWRAVSGIFREMGPVPPVPSFWDRNSADPFRVYRRAAVGRILAELKGLIDRGGA